MLKKASIIASIFVVAISLLGYGFVSIYNIGYNAGRDAGVGEGETNVLRKMRTELALKRPENWNSYNYTVFHETKWFKLFRYEKEGVTYLVVENYG